MSRLRPFILLLLLSAPLCAQDALVYPGRPRYPDGLLSLQAAGGYSKYTGDFSDHNVDAFGMLRAAYAIFPSFSLGLEGKVGKLTFERRSRRDAEATYEYQFGEENMILRSTKFSSFHVLAQFNLFPRAYVTGAVFAGAGATFFDPEDYAEEKVTVRPKGENHVALSIPAGRSAEVFLLRSISVGVEFAYTFLFSDRVDAFPPVEIREAYFKEFGRALGEDVTEGNDGYFTLGLHAKIYLLEDNDPDGDLLVNKEEERHRSNPYDQDTDGDGLSDYEEAVKFSTNPLDRDSDMDGLSDYLEIARYRTDPLKKDSDGDGLNDADEVQVHLSDPLRVDSDGDGLQDGREVLIGTSPIRFDSDGDGLDDRTEVEVSKTNPVVADTDGEGLSDFIEFRAHRTDPSKPDTDGDGLNDMEEVVEYRTNPLQPDTDGETLTDFDEIRRIGTDPLKRDTDGDGITDEKDRCPLDPETYNGFQDDDGCPDTAPGAVAAAAGSGKGARPLIGATGKSIERMDTVKIYEGRIITLFGVNFEVDKDIIRPESYPILEENARLFSLYPNLVVEIRGHTDSDASDEYNQDLSERRAKSVRNFLAGLGVAPDRMSTKGFGESMPIAPNTDEIGKARNRRIEFYVVKTGLEER